MNKIEREKKRIDKRKKCVIDVEVKALGKNEAGALYKGVMTFFTLCALFLSFAIYAKKDENATLFNSVFDTNINFKSFNKGLNSLFNPRVVDVEDEIKDQVVSSNVSYIYLGDDYYSCEGDLLVAIDDGVVTYVNGKDNDYTLIVEYDSGFRGTYYNVREVNVYVNDRVYSDDILGSFEEKVEMLFVKDGSKISYEEVIGII